MTKLTKSLKQYLEKYDIVSDDIRINAVLDVNENFGFSDTYLVLTADRLVLAAYEERKSGHVHQFGGYSHTEQSEQADKMFHRRHILIKRIEQEKAACLLTGCLGVTPRRGWLDTRCSRCRRS